MASRIEFASGPHLFRRVARKSERQWQKYFNALEVYEDIKDEHPTKLKARPISSLMVDHPTEVPKWARGVKVLKAGHFQYLVVFTENRGH